MFANGNDRWCCPRHQDTRDKYKAKSVSIPQWIYDVDCPSSDASIYDTLADCQRQWITDGKGDHKFDVVDKMLF